MKILMTTEMIICDEPGHFVRNFIIEAILFHDQSEEDGN